MRASADVPGAQGEAGPVGLGVVQRRGAHDAAGVQGDRDRGPVAGGMPVHATEGDDDSARRRIGHPPEPALHLGAVRRHRVAERHVRAGAPVGGDQPAPGARRDPAQPVRRAHRGGTRWITLEHGASSSRTEGDHRRQRSTRRAAPRRPHFIPDGSVAITMTRGLSSRGHERARHAAGSGNHRARSFGPVWLDLHPSDDCVHDYPLQSRTDCRTRTDCLIWQEGRDRRHRAQHVDVDHPLPVVLGEATPAPLAGEYR